MFVAHAAPGDGPITRLDLIDPRSGRVKASVSGDEVMLSFDLVGDERTEVRRGDAFDLYNPATLERSGRVLAPGLAGQPASIVQTTAGVVAATHRSLLLLDRAGEVRATMPIDPTGDESYVPALRALPNSDVVVAAGDQLLVVHVHVDGAGLRRRSSRQAWVIGGQDVDGSTVLAVIPSPSAGNDWVPAMLVDASTGEARWSGMWPLTFDARLLANGFLSILPGSDGGRTTLVAHALDGRETWRHTLAQPNVSPIPDGLVEFGTTAQGSGRTTITLFGWHRRLTGVPALATMLDIHGSVVDPNPGPPLRFGIFLPPMHPIGQNPSLTLKRDLRADRAPRRTRVRRGVDR